MKCLEKIFIVSAIALLFPLCASGTPYYGFTDFGDFRYYADKSRITYDNDMLCWASATSNVLQYTGWGKVQGHNFKTTDDLFSNYLQHWTNKTGLIQYGWNWYFDGSKQSQELTSWSQADKAGGGFFSTKSFNNYFVEDGNNSNAMKNIDAWLHDGCRVGLSIYEISESGGHALTSWGFKYNKAGKHQGFYSYDSDYFNGVDSLHYYKVKKGQWRLKGVYKEQHIGDEVQSLSQAPAQPVPEPSTLLLMGLGMSGLTYYIRSRRQWH